VDRYQQALDIGREIGNRNGQFEAHHGIGRAHHATGDHQGALHRHRDALELAVDLDQAPDQARAHDGLAHAQLALGNTGQARHHWQTALSLLTGVGTDHTDEPDVTTEAIRGHLHGLDDHATAG
jgi:Flp pilus assembly protein TadD